MNVVAILAHMRKYDDLLCYAQAYLQLAKLGCQELLEPHHNATEEIPNWKMDYTVQIVGPVIYNTKHGIECFLKVLQQVAGENYDTVHHLHLLFAAVRSILEAKTWTPLEDNGDEINQEEINNMPSNLKKIEDLVDYFYNNRMIDEKIGTGDIPDPKNELFRYPKMQNGTTFDYGAFLSKIDDNDIKALKQKINELYAGLNDIGYFLAVSLRQP